MQYMPEFIRDTYNGEHKDDYALKARIAMEGLKDHPQDAEHIYAYTCSFLYAAKQHEECVAHGFKYLPLTSIAECRENILRHIVWALEALDRFDEAMEIRKQMLQAENAHMSSSFHKTEIAEAYEKKADYKNAIEYYEMLDEDERDGEIHEKLGDLYDKVKDFNNAAANYLKAARYHSQHSSWFWRNTGRMLALAGKEEEAKFYLQVALAINPQDAHAHYCTGLLYQNKGDIYRALHHYTEALKIQPEFPEVYTNLAAISFNENGDIKDAIQNIETALQQNPDTQLLITLYLNLSQLYKKISDYDNHEYYKAKMMQAIGFDVEITDDEEDDDEETGV